jgi:hypothetical protein
MIIKGWLVQIPIVGWFRRLEIPGLVGSDLIYADPHFSIPVFFSIFGT